MNNLKKLRQEKGWRQKDVAEQLGITQQAYANYERGERQPDFNILKKISEIFDVSIDFLIGSNEKKAPEYHKVTDMIEKTLSGTDLTDENGKLNDKGIQVILEVIQNNKEMLKARVKELKDKKL